MKALLGVGFFCSLYLLLVVPVEAASLYFDPGSVTANRGDTITMALRLDTDTDECVNAIDATITYPENIELVDTSRGNSIMSVWLEDPKIDRGNRQLTFAGGIPNGYCGRIIGDPRLTNTILELVFTVPGLSIGTTESGNVAEIDYDETTRVLLNDGFGTEAPLTLLPARILLTDKVGNVVVNEWTDRVAADEEAPNSFSISLERSENAFSNRYFIVFNTTDKQSGIDYYEVIEEPLAEANLFTWGAVDAPWARVESPYVLTDQTLNSTIRVRAFDKAGNEYVATLVPNAELRSTSASTKILIALVAGVGIAIVIAAAIYFWVRRREEVDEDEA